MSTPASPSQSPPPSPAPSDPALIHASNLTVLYNFSKPGLKRPALPVEIIVQILSHSSQWFPSVKLALTSPLSVSSMVGSKVILCSPPLTSKSIRLLRKVVFTFKSRDQGWSSYQNDHGTYENTWTWFDAVVGSHRTEPSPRTNQEDRFDEGDSGRPGAYREVQDRFGWATAKIKLLQENRHASRVAEDYRIELGPEHEILQNLKEGDEIALLASACFPGWVNNVEEAGMEIWEVDDLQQMVANMLRPG